MSKIDTLIERFKEHIQLPWTQGISANERVIFVIYDPADERQLLTKLDNFAHAAREANHDWLLFDLADQFGNWLSKHDYREGLFADPTAIADAVDDGFLDHLEAEFDAKVGEAVKNPETVVAVSGVGSLFDLIKTRKFIERCSPKVKGRLVLFFPGRIKDNNYHLLNKLDGWDYLAVPIVAGSR